MGFTVVATNHAKQVENYDWIILLKKHGRKPSCVSSDGWKGHQPWTPRGSARTETAMTAAAGMAPATTHTATPAWGTDPKALWLPVEEGLAKFAWPCCSSLHPSRLLCAPNTFYNSHKALTLAPGLWGGNRNGRPTPHFLYDKKEY